ncbi:MAG: hypothetical protein RJA07_573 [Bacteroidota bacterium]|jgi:ribosome-associated toxin RatA of RatAB toxin-antitoxin module
MKLVLKILKWVGIVIVALLVISFFLPSTSHVERTYVVKASPPVVYALVNDLHKWETWSPWYEMDKKMKITYNEIPSGKGASYTWVSQNKNVGNGSMEIIDATSNEIKTQMHFGDMGNPTATFKFEAVPEGTKVTWAFEGDCSENPFYLKPICRYFNLIMDKMIGPDFEKGLKNLDAVASPIAN